MPLVVLLFVAARVGGGTAAGERSHYSNLFLTVHVGFVLAAFAGFTLAAALASLYLLEERRLQRRAPDILRLRLPSLVVLERLTVRTIAIALPLLTVGLAAGIVRLREQGRGLDATDGGGARRPGSSTPASSSRAPTGPARRAARARRVRAS